MMTTAKEVREHYDKASEAASAFVEQEARAILCKHRNLHEFVMGMGIWSFTTKNGDSHLPGFHTTPRYITNSRLAKFIFEWDSYLKITGEPMRFTADGPTVREW